MAVTPTDERSPDETRMRLLGYGITNEFEYVLSDWGWKIEHETPDLGAYMIEVVYAFEMIQECRIAGQAIWDPRPAPVNFEMLRDEALMDALLRVLEYGEFLTADA